MFKVSYFIVMTLFLSSCSTFVLYPKEYRSLPPRNIKPKVYVKNPELSVELDILKKSNLFTITNDSTVSKQVRLKELFIRRQSGTFIIPALVITLGFFPVQASDRYLFEFDEITPDTTRTRTFELWVATKISIYELFLFSSNRNELLGKSLFGNYLNNNDRPGLSPEQMGHEAINRALERKFD